MCAVLSLSLSLSSCVCEGISVCVCLQVYCCSIYILIMFNLWQQKGDLKANNGKCRVKYTPCGTWVCVPPSLSLLRSPCLCVAAAAMRVYSSLLLFNCPSSSSICGLCPSAATNFKFLCVPKAFPVPCIRRVGEGGGEVVTWAGSLKRITPIPVIKCLALPAITVAIS